MVQVVRKEKKPSKEDALTEAFISANLDVSLLDNVAFREFVKILDPSFKLPNWAKLAKFIRAAEEKKAEKIGAAMKEAVAIALTTDIATTFAGACNAVTAHWLSKEWELRSAVIALSIMDSQWQPRVYLSSVVRTSEEPWRNGVRNIAVMTDGAVGGLPLTAASTLRARAGVPVVELEERIRCWCHSLHLSVTFSLAIPQVGELVDECIDLVSVFKYNDAVSETLHELQQLRIEKERKGQEQKNTESRAAEEPVGFLDMEMEELYPVELNDQRQIVVEVNESLDAAGRYRSCFVFECIHCFCLLFSQCFRF